MGAYDEIKAAHQADEEVGGPRFVVMPGLVNAHHHGRGVSTFQMGCIDDCLETWILSGWGRRPYDQYLMTLYTAIQMIESGTTTTMYNHAQTPAQIERLVQRNTAVVLMAKKWSHTSLSNSVTGTLSLPMMARALLTRMSMRPN